MDDLMLTSLFPFSCLFIYRQVALCVCVCVCDCFEVVSSLDFRSSFIQSFKSSVLELVNYRIQHDIRWIMKF